MCLPSFLRSSADAAILYAAGNIFAATWKVLLAHLCDSSATRHPKSRVHSAPSRLQIDWEDRRLVWAVREPFRSKHSSADLVTGVLEEGNRLFIESLMPSGGVIFSDGIESDYLEFHSGTLANFSASAQRARVWFPCPIAAAYLDVMMTLPSLRSLAAGDMC